MPADSWWSPSDFRRYLHALGPDGPSPLPSVALIARALNKAQVFGVSSQKTNEGLLRYRVRPAVARDALRSARDAVADELREETTRAALAKADADERHDAIAAELADAKAALVEALCGVGADFDDLSKCCDERDKVDRAPIGGQKIRARRCLRRGRGAKPPPLRRRRQR